MSDTAPATKRSRREAMGPFGPVGKIVDELDDRLGVAKGGRVFLDKIFPDHWSFMLGEIALYSFVVLIATGIFLSLYYVPSSADVEPSTPRSKRSPNQVRQLLAQTSRSRRA